MKFNVTLVFPFLCRQVDYEGFSKLVVVWLMELDRETGRGGQLTIYITSLLFLMAQHRTILKIIPMI